jgi:hypothetical protein
MNEQEFRKGGAPMKVHADEGLKVVGEETEDGIFIPDGVTLPKMAKDLHEVKQALRQADGQIDQLNVAVNARDRELHALRLQVIQLYEVLTDQEFPADSHNLMPTSEILAPTRPTPMPLVNGEPTGCGDCTGTDPVCRCCPWGVDERGLARDPPGSVLGPVLGPAQDLEIRRRVGPAGLDPALVVDFHLRWQVAVGGLVIAAGLLASIVFAPPLFSAAVFLVFGLVVALTWLLRHRS